MSDLDRMVLGAALGFLILAAWRSLSEVDLARAESRIVAACRPDGGTP